MKYKQIASALLVVTINGLAFAQYGSPESLKAEMNQGDDLVFAKEAKPLTNAANLSNAVFSPAANVDGKSPALVVLHTCGGISQHIRMWADAAVKRGYVVLTVDGMRGLKTIAHHPQSSPTDARSKTRWTLWRIWQACRMSTASASL